MTQPAPQPAQAPDRRPAPERRPEPEPQSSSEEHQASAQSAEHGTTTARRKGPPKQPPGPGGEELLRSSARVDQGVVLDAAKKLGRTSRNAGKVGSRSWLALLILTVVAIGAVVGGLLAKNAAFWTGASVVFYMALAAVIAYAARELGVVSQTTAILRAALQGGGEKPQQPDPKEAGEDATQVGGAALVLARRFEDAGHLAEAEHAYLMAVEETGNKDALYWLGQQYVARGNQMEGELWLLKAAGRGHLGANYRLGCLHRRHGQTIGDATYNELFNLVGVAAYIVGRNGAVPDSKYSPNYIFSPHWLSKDDLARFAIESADIMTGPESRTEGTPDTENRNRESDSVPRKSEIFKDLADTLPEQIEFRQAYFASLLGERGIESTREAVAEAREKYPHKDEFELLDIRLNKTGIFELFIKNFPEYMRPELYFHAAFDLIGKLSDQDIGNDLRRLRSKAGPRSPDQSLWRSQLIAIEAAYEYGRGNYKKAGELLESALELRPRLAGPLGTDDIRSLSLILKHSDEYSFRPLISELTSARPKLKDALSSYEPYRKIFLESLISSTVPGMDIADPLPASSGLSVAEINHLVSSAGEESED